MQKELQWQKEKKLFKILSAIGLVITSWLFPLHNAFEVSMLGTKGENRWTNLERTKIPKWEMQMYVYIRYMLKFEFMQKAKKLVLAVSRIFKCLDRQQNMRSVWVTGQ